MCVVLHSANRTAYDYLGFGHLDRKIDNGDDPSTVATRSPDDFYALYLSSTNAEWYGWKAAHTNPSYATAPTPAEKRLLETIEWVVTRYGIDRNRIYLCGVSMGGCGTLALGLPHGDIFAAIRVQVPAGTEYAAARMGGFPAAPAADATPAERATWTKTISSVSLPDPPVLVDFSAQNDNWSKTQPPLVHAAEAGHLPLVLSWGPFHHCTFTSLVAKFPICDVALAFPWFDIRKDEAYPVFTHASSDQRSPWSGDPANFDESGQINAWFRWKSESDTPARFAMQLWLAHPEVSNPPATMPDASTTDITLRRLQRFKPQPGASYTWQITRGGQSIASGKVTPDAANLLTIPRVTLTTESAELLVTADAK
jgi:pimeloyl-ACP methyl ester carboxylesterase